ncbi:hypothetical protein MMC19_003872 [Ptychographa xylographoides]|nr:hypothetical protein [Ptychographa xylographoides]
MSSTQAESDCAKEHTNTRILPLVLAIADLEHEWSTSLQRKFLIRLVQKYVIPNHRITIDSALCLGLGSFSNRSLEPLLFPRRLVGGYDEERKPSDNEYYTSSSGNESEREVVVSKSHRQEADNSSTSMASNGGLRNISLYQLMLFETVLECLRMFSLHFAFPYSPSRCILASERKRAQDSPFNTP